MNRNLFAGLKNSSIRRRVSAVMAVVVAVTGVASYTYLNRHEVAAKDTLDSITKVVSGISESRPYTILEITPGYAPYVVSLNGLDGQIHMVSGNQLMGFTGYYIKNSEPIRTNIKEAINDKIEITTVSSNGFLVESDHIYTRSSVSDSNMRYQIADKMFGVLGEQGIVNNTAQERSILNAETFTDNEKVTHYRVYEEHHEGDVIQNGNINVALDKSNYKSLGYELLDKIYTYSANDTNHYDENGKSIDGGVYIDYAKGSMEHKVSNNEVRQISANYIRTYDSSMSDNKFAEVFVSANLIDENSESDDENNNGNQATDEEDENLLADTLRYLSANSAERGDEWKGDFDPGLVAAYDDNEYKYATGDAYVYAVFRETRNAAFGYKVKDTVSVTAENYINYPIDTPVYELTDGVYRYAGTISSNLVKLEDNSEAKALDGRVYAFVESHPNKIALSSSGASDELDISSGSYANAQDNGTIVVEDTYDTDNNDSIESNAGNDSGDNSHTVVNEPTVDIVISQDIDMYNDDVSGNDVSGNGVSGNGVSGNSVSDNDIDDEDGEYVLNDGLYIVYFEYSKDQNTDKDTFYEVDSFKGATAEEGAQYVTGYDENLKEDSRIPALVPNYNGTGCIEAGVTDETRNYYVYEYAFDRGNYVWTPKTFDQNYDYKTVDDAYRLKGSEIYYKISFTNNEWFKQYVLDRNEGKECDDLNVKVKCISANNIKSADVDEAKMTVVMSSDASFTLFNSMNNELKEKYPEFKPADYDRDKADIDQNILKKLVNRAAVDKIPSVVDYRIVEKADDNVNKIKGSFIYRFAQAMMLDAPDKYYDAISNLDLDEESNNREPDETPNTNTLTYNDCHYVNKNVYIYNMKWEKQSDGTLLNPVNNYLYTMSNTDRLKGFTEEEIAAGFDEVLLDINNENLFRETDNANGDRPLLDTNITEARALRYIIGYAQRREESIKGKMRILEIEPTPNFDLQVNDSGERVNEYWGDKSNTSYRNGTFATDDGKLFFKNDKNNPLVDQKDTRIELTRMSVAEFVGHIEDLNAEYDMIYIGMNIEGLNTSAADDNDVTKGLATVEVTNTYDRWGRVNGTKKVYTPEKLTVYNDPDMRGLVYSSIGDYVYMKGNLLGNDPVDYTSTNRGAKLIPASSISADSKKYRTRYSGNDITAEDIKKLNEFLDAGYPIVLADEFYKSVTAAEKEIDTNRVDTVSYMYQFVNGAKNKKNMFALSSMNKKLFNWYLNLSKPELTMSGTAADAMVSPQYIYLDQVDNYYHAIYDFKIANKGAASSESTYNAALYIDINADGKYSHTQEGIRLTSIYTVDGDQMYGTEDLDGNVVYNLRTGVEYVANCQLAASFEGVVPWRLEITQNDNVKRRTNATGYYQINRNELTPIKVLQIKTGSGNRYGGNSSTTWDMASTSKDVNNIFCKLLNDHNVVKYDVDIESYSANDFDDLKFLPASQRTEANKTKETYLSELENYDMLVMGFADCYRAPVEKNAILAIQEYIADGNSCLFSHDCSSYVNYLKGSESNKDNGDYGTHWGYEFNRYIRNLVGMDRYNVLGTTDWDSAEWGNIFESTAWKDALDDSIPHNYDVAYVPKSGVRGEDGTVTGGIIAGSKDDRNGDANGSIKYLQNQGYSWFGMNKKRAWHDQSNRGISLKYRYVDKFYADGSDGQESNGVKYDVTQVNEGQITKYPYNLPATFVVASTHGQYYQLDFTADDDMDGETDIVVWYCIGGSANKSHDKDMYELTANDVRNNYYIYNKGSITYTGVGHSGVLNGNNPTGSEDEVKLFINTLIACYQQGAHEPTLNIVEGYEKNARNINNIYISYDKMLHDDSTLDSNGVLDNYVDLYFKTEKTSLVQNAAFISHQISAKFYYEAEATDPGAVEITDGGGNKFYGIEVTPVEFKYDNDSYDGDVDNLADRITYKAKLPVKRESSDEMWAAYTPTVSANKLNARKILVVTTDTTTNSKTHKSKYKSSVKSVSLVRAQMFMLD
ncbi:MAG: DUF5057 domain-containing protein [Lachnospiraceae bacterium]|nr:DUF5057 domain-containing protein [Lachnospiraceae bacterium]